MLYSNSILQIYFQLFGIKTVSICLYSKKKTIPEYKLLTHVIFYQKGKDAKTINLYLFQLEYGHSKQQGHQNDVYDVFLLTLLPVLRKS